MTVLCDPAADDVAKLLVDFFAPLAGQPARMVISVNGAVWVQDGRVPLRRDWPSPDRPCLLVAPGATPGVHVLAPMALHLLVHAGRLVLARRRWYEEDWLDFESIGSGPVIVRLEPLP